MSREGERINLRIDAEQERLLEATVEAEHTTVPDFILAAATTVAANRLAKRPCLILNEEQWTAFTEFLDGPPATLRMPKISSVHVKRHVRTR